MSGWIPLLALAIGALVGYAHGLIAAVLSLLGLFLGGVIGLHIAGAIALGAPGWAALGGLLGALSGASILGRIGRRVRDRTRIPGLGLADGILGAVLGACVALAVLPFASPILASLQHGLPAARSGFVTRIEQALGGPAAGPPGAGPARR